MRGVAEKGLKALARGGACLVVLALAACVTVPERTQSEWLGALPADATAYVSLTVPGSSSMIKKILAKAGPGTEDIGTLLDMTQRLVCSVTLGKDAAPRFSAVALGGYPAGIIGMRLGGNKEWARKSGPTGSYWEWSKNGVQMSIPGNSLLLAANGDMDLLLARWSSPLPLAVPADVAADMEKTDLVLYMPELPGNLAESAAQKGLRLPIQEIWVDALKVSGGYDISGTANTGSAQEAKILSLALKLGLVAWMRTEKISDTASKLKTIVVSPVGIQVKLSGLHLSEDEVIALFLSVITPPLPSESAAPVAPEASP
jgi:hypothetical protein